MASQWPLHELPWLVPAPRDLRPEPRGAELFRWAQHRLSDPQLRRLAKSIAQARADGQSAPLAALKLGLLSDGTTDFVAPALVASAARYGVSLELVVANFGQLETGALDPGSPLRQSTLDAVLLAPVHQQALGDVPFTERVRGAAARFGDLRARLEVFGSAQVLVATLPDVPEALFGSLDRAVPGTLSHGVAEWNHEVFLEAARRGDIVVDVARLAQTVGLAEWQDPAQWGLYRLPFAQRLVPLYADFVARVLGALRGRARKCVVLDLDNTLWGGVIGDDGLDGLALGPGDARGEAFSAFQRALLGLRARGVILAVCSKNDEATARRVFREHPNMSLREEHIAAWRVDWRDKATNVRELAAELGLGLDAMVLVDDNPAERAQVRGALADVAVPELPEDPALFVRALLTAGYFESLAFTDADASRAEQYRATTERRALRASESDSGAFLRSLEMKATIAPFDTAVRARVVQLINKTNQFNLTTRRYTEAEVAALEADPAVLGLQVRLVDRFGDNGMVSVVICRTAGDRWLIDTWLMSCRVLGRRLEEVVLDELVARARRAGITTLVGRFVPSGRNDLVREHYAKLGFEGGDGEWRLAVGSARSSDAPIGVEAQPGPST